MLFDTIAAISTPRGSGAISIVRISGDESLEILARIFEPISGKPVASLGNFTINYGHIVENGRIIDEVLVSIMKGQKTYTKEDIVEINCHGGHYVTNEVLELVLRNGARLAEKGEFTRRAFLNGRIDLAQAESIMDVINSKNETSTTISLGQMRGDLSSKIAELKEKILMVAAHVNVVLDYPEEGIDDPVPAELVANLREVKADIDNLIASYDKGKVIREGVKIAIVGKPNVGKSSILNALLREDRAIVTDIPGTTRDIIEEQININGISLSFVDTAGIRETEDVIENIGVEKSKKQLDIADVILLVVDGSADISPEDMQIYDYLVENGKISKVLGIINKIDINNILDISKLPQIQKWINMSAVTKSGLDTLEKEIYDHVINKNIESSGSEIIITNVRHKAALARTNQAIDNVLETIETNMPMDLIAVDIKDAMDNLGEITGEISSEELLDKVFSNFCVGK